MIVATNYDNAYKRGHKTKQAYADRYWVRDARCIGCACFVPGEIRIDKPNFPWLSSLSYLKTRRLLYSACCLTQYYSGCPDETGYDFEAWKKAWKNGWRTSVV